MPCLAVPLSMTVPDPEKLAYLPRDSRSYRPAIGLIGCGGISVEHLTAYRDAGYDVVALSDIVGPRAVGRRDEFFPDATVFTDHRDLLALEEIQVVDITTHPQERVALIEAALRAGKHVLSQKPFALDLDVGQRLVELAEGQGLRLAVNQNGRWAPHFSYMRAAVQAGLLGHLESVQMSVQWDHTWVVGTPFATLHHLVLYDFAIHWFDMLCCLFRGRPAKRVFATTTRTAGQSIEPPLLGQAIVEFEHGQASLLFAAETKQGPRDHSYLAGSAGSLESSGPDYKRQQVTLWCNGQEYQPQLQGTWFPDGFRGAMGELLCSIEEGREPITNARDNLNSLALCFAAVASADSQIPVVPGQVRKLPIERITPLS